MNNRNRDNKKNNTTTGIVIAVVVWLLGSILSASDFGAVLMSVLGALATAVVGYALAKVYLSKKTGEKHGSVYHMERAKEKAKHIFMREEFEQNEKAVKCTHPRGKEKYFAQLDNFLANGLIEKSEYRILKERYEKVVIPENMH